MNSWPSATTNVTYTAINAPYYERTPRMIDSPAFLQIDLHNQTRITGRFESYTDPEDAGIRGAFVAKAADGTVHYMLWAAILRVAVFPLTAGTLEVPSPAPISPDAA